MAFRKMKRSFRPRRRFIRRRRRFGFKRRGKNTFVSTQQHGGLTNIAYKGRKLGLKRWRSGLYRSSMYDAHYRSVFLGQDTYQTGTIQGVSTPVRYLPELGSATNIGFWTAAGGLQILDRNVTPPDFIGDITIRGGKVGLNVTVADSVTDVIAVSVYLTFIKSGTRDPSAYINGAVPYIWDSQVQADASAGGWKVLKKWTALLNYNNPALQIEHRLKPRKIDQALYMSNNVNFATTPSNQFCFVVHACNLTSATDVALVVHRMHNLAFAADADTIVT